MPSAIPIIIDIIMWYLTLPYKENQSNLKIAKIDEEKYRRDRKVNKQPIILE
jgi:hypothetical protein